MKITTVITMMAASAILLCGCGDNSSKGATKAELRERIIKKYSRVLPREQIISMLDGGDSSNSAAAIIGLVKAGCSDAFEADLRAYNAAED